MVGVHGRTVGTGLMPAGTGPVFLLAGVAFGISRGDFDSALQRFKHEATFTYKKRSYVFRLPN